MINTILKLLMKFPTKITISASVLIAIFLGSLSGLGWYLNTIIDPIQDNIKIMIAESSHTMANNLNTTYNKIEGQFLTLNATEQLLAQKISTLSANQKNYRQQINMIAETKVNTKDMYEYTNAVANGLYHTMQIYHNDCKDNKNG